jgi:hypothetical protein
MISRRRAVLSAAAAVGTGATLALPASGDVEQRTRLQQAKASHLSRVVSLRVAAADPAPPPALRERAEALHDVAARARERTGSGPYEGKVQRGVFNADNLGLPQNEESVNACRSNTRTVLEGTNDYRGLLDPDGNFTGWHLSRDGGRTLANEGLLPPVAVGPLMRPSGGDPVVAIDTCATSTWSTSTTTPSTPGATRTASACTSRTPRRSRRAPAGRTRRAGRRPARPPPARPRTSSTSRGATWARAATPARWCG